MRRALVVAIAAASMLVVAPPASAQTVQLEASFQEFFGKSAAHPCQAFVCGTGTVAGFGEATSTFDVVEFSGFDPETGCATTTAERVITLADGSTLTLLETGTVCTPGNSTFAPGALKSFGNPAFVTSTFTVVGGTGVFAGATGTGTVTMMVAGESGHSTLSGTLEL